MEEKKKTTARPRKEEGQAHECGGCGGCGNHGHHEEPDWKSIAQYKAAELENYIKRQRDAVQNAFNDGRIHVLLSILPIGDSLSEAMKT